MEFRMKHWMSDLMQRKTFCRLEYYRRYISFLILFFLQVFKVIPSSFFHLFTFFSPWVALVCSTYPLLLFVNPDFFTRPLLSFPFLLLRFFFPFICLLPQFFFSSSSTLSCHCSCFLLSYFSFCFSFFSSHLSTFHPLFLSSFFISSFIISPQPSSFFSWLVFLLLIFLSWSLAFVYPKVLLLPVPSSVSPPLLLAALPSVSVLVLFLSSSSCCSLFAETLFRNAALLLQKSMQIFSSSLFLFESISHSFPLPPFPFLPFSCVYFFFSIKVYSHQEINANAAIDFHSLFSRFSSTRWESVSFLARKSIQIFQSCCLVFVSLSFLPSISPTLPHVFSLCLWPTRVFFCETNANIFLIFFPSFHVCCYILSLTLSLAFFLPCISLPLSPSFARQPSLCGWLLRLAW